MYIISYYKKQLTFLTTPYKKSIATKMWFGSVLDKVMLQCSYANSKHFEVPDNLMRNCPWAVYPKV